MKTFKLKISNEEESRKVQKHAFNLGYAWFAGGQNIQETDKQCLYFDKEGYITHSYNDHYFYAVKNYQEISVEDFLKLKKCMIEDKCNSCINCDIVEKPKEKVYCKDCVHCSSYRTSNLCTHPKSAIKTDTAYEVVIEYTSIEKFNSNNDCKNFEKKPVKDSIL